MNKKNKNISDIINQYPKLKKWAKRSGVGLLFSALFSLVIELVGEVNFDELMEWIKQLISLILSIPTLIILPLVIVVLIFIYKYTKLKEKWKFKQKFLKDTKEMIEKDSSISDISIQEDKKNESISINIQRDKKKTLNAKSNGKIVDFHYPNSEVK